MRWCGCDGAWGGSGGGGRQNAGMTMWWYHCFLRVGEFIFSFALIL